MTTIGSDRKKNTHYPLASMMTSMRPLTHGILGSGTDEGRKAYDKDFALAY